MNIALVSESALVSDADLAWIAAAVDAQAQEFCRAHNLAFCPVSVVARGFDPSPDVTHVIKIVDSLDVAGALGYHDDQGGVILGFVLAQPFEATAKTVSHEVLELLGDPTCDRWGSWTGGGMQAYEVCDRCEDDSYDESVTILGESRMVPVSDYLLPTAFQENSAGPWDRMNRLKSWDEVRPGGYVIVMDPSGNVRNVFAERGAMPATFARKLENPRSRTMRRMRNPMRPHVASPEGSTA